MTGAEFRNHRKELGWTVKVCAERLGVGRWMVWKYERDGPSDRAANAMKDKVALYREVMK